MLEDRRERYFSVCPEFIVEVRSKSDSARMLHAKMQAWLDNGAQLAWMIDPFARTVTVFRPGADAEVLMSPENVAGEGPVQGFVLTTEKLWATE